MAEELVRKHGAKPAFKGYSQGGKVPFPGSICASINSMKVVHGTPSRSSGSFAKATSSAWTSAWCSTAGTATRRSRSPSGRVSENTSWPA